MNRIKKALYKFSLSDKNLFFRLLAKKPLPEQLFGETYEITYNDGSFPVRIERGSKGIIFDIHGGGYLFGSYLDENHFCHYLHEKTGLTVVSCNYDLTTHSQFPVQIEQIYQTVVRICDDPSVETEKIFIMGHSAGGNATAAVTLLSIDRGSFHVDGNVLVYPVLDLSCDPKSRPRVKGNLITNGMMELF
nr:alpha/beta hydrolase [Clostridiales bacterium]